MSLRLPQGLAGPITSRQAALDNVETEILAETASALGRAGKKATEALHRLDDPAALAETGREALLRAAADAVWAFFIQRESCGQRDHRQHIQEMKIPRAVLIRMGAR